MDDDCSEQLTDGTRDFGALLDVSRLISRVGYGPHTGVDRVELAYLEWCLATAPMVFGVARISGGFALLDRSGLASVRDCIVGMSSWGKRDARGLLGIKTPKMRARAESDVRRFAVEYRPTADFGTKLPAKLVYLNTGHSNLSHDFLKMVTTKVSKIAIFVHDLIPMQYPEFQRAESVTRFKEKMELTDEFSDLILVNSNDTKSACRKHFSKNHNTVVSHLGVDIQSATSMKFGDDRPYFLTIGTIEPRKNHGLLLDVWDLMPVERRPHLHIVGRRGWKNERTFQRLDSLSTENRVTEHNDLSDLELWSMLAGAKALLFPSYAEGFGLPSLEAASLGIPVICGDLAIHRELLGDYPVYVDLKDPYLWKKKILELTQAKTQPQRHAPHIPTWDEHFTRVNKAITKNW